MKNFGDATRPLPVAAGEPPQVLRGLFPWHKQRSHVGEEPASTHSDALAKARQCWPRAHVSNDAINADPWTNCQLEIGES